MDITNFFNSKKRDLSNNSNTEEDAKRQGEESPSEILNVSIHQKYMGMFLKKV